MITYSPEEIWSATDVVRNFSTILRTISDKQTTRVVIVKNNRFEAVMLGVAEYEKLQHSYEILKAYYDKQQGL